jgi:hypothetical protein
MPQLELITFMSTLDLHLNDRRSLSILEVVSWHSHVNPVARAESMPPNILIPALAPQMLFQHVATAF